MYLGSKIVLAILVAMILARIALGLAIAVIIFGPNSGISGTLLFFRRHRPPDVDRSKSDRMDPFWNLCLRSERQHGQFAPIRMGHPRHPRQLALVLTRRGMFPQTCP